VVLGIVVGVLCLAVSLENAKANWYYGINNQKLDPTHEMCHLQAPGSPWIALLPNRALNFFSNL